MDLCHLPNPICSLSSLYCKQPTPSLRLNAKRYGQYFQFHHRKTVIYSKPQEVANSAIDNDYDQDEEEEARGDRLSGIVKLIGSVIPIPGQGKDNNEKNLGIIAACIVGLFTGIGVVLFNNVVHEIRYIFWDQISPHSASLLREEPIQDTWKQIIVVPVCGGILVSIVNALGASLESDAPFKPGTPFSNLRPALRSFLKALSASFTLGTGNSLGPEGPSVEIGASIAKGISKLFTSAIGTRLSLIAAGSAAGFSSGFNAAVAGCFFAVESVLRPSSVESSPSVTNTTSMVILSAVIAAVVSQVGLGSEPAFKVPEYDFRSPTDDTIIIQYISRAATLHFAGHHMRLGLVVLN